MPESYQVVKAAFKKQVAKKDGNGFFHVYTYLLDPLDGGQAKDAEEFVHSSEPMLQEGHVEGTITQGDYGLKFKRADKGAPIATVSGGLSESRSSYRPMDPNREASIIRQHSQTAAVYYAAILQKASPDLQPSYEWLKGIVDWFDEDVAQNAGKAK